MKRRLDAADVEHIGALVTGGLLLIKGMRAGGALGTLFKLGGAALIYRGQKGYARLYDAVGLELKKEPTGVGKQNVKVETSIVIDRSPMDLYKIWRHFENLPTLMSHLQDVEELDDERSLWTAKAPLGRTVSWEARIIRDVPGEIIAWETLEGSGVDTAGSIRFEPYGDGGTHLKVTLRYDPPADLAGYAVAKLFGLDAQRQIDADLRKFKAAMEIRGTDGVHALPA